jgi:hypothetical protein
LFFFVFFVFCLFVCFFIFHPLDKFPHVSIPLPPIATHASPSTHALEYLDVGHNGLGNLAELGLQALPALRALILHGNNISRVEGLDGCPRLEKLVLNKCRVRTLPPPTSLTLSRSLLELHLEDCSLRSLAWLPAMERVKALFVGVNRIADVGEFACLASWPALEQLSLTSNPCTRRRDYRTLVLARVPALLVIDEAVVTEEERERGEIVMSQVSMVPPNIVLAGSANVPVVGGPVIPPVSANGQRAIRISTLSFGGPPADLAPRRGGRRP